jgi:hypothetical protein
VNSKSLKGYRTLRMSYMILELQAINRKHNLVVVIKEIQAVDLPRDNCKFIKCF